MLQGNPQYWNGYRNFYGIALDENNTVFVLSRVVNGSTCGGGGGNNSMTLLRFSDSGNCLGQTGMGAFFEVKNFTCQQGKIVYTGDFKPSGSQVINLRMDVSDTLGNIINSIIITHQATVGCPPGIFDVASHTVLSNGDVIIIGDVSLG